MSNLDVSKEFARYHRLVTILSIVSMTLLWISSLIVIILVFLDVIFRSLAYLISLCIILIMFFKLLFSFGKELNIKIKPYLENVELEEET